MTQRDQDHGKTEEAQTTLQAFSMFARATRLEYAYQMLLLLVILTCADENGAFTLEMASERFAKFYQARLDAGLPAEKIRGKGKKQAVIDIRHLRTTILIGPIPRFERRGFITLQASQKQGTRWIVAAPLWEELSAFPLAKATLRELALDRLAVHFGEEKTSIEQLVAQTIG